MTLKTLLITFLEAKMVVGTCTNKCSYTNIALPTFGDNIIEISSTSETVLLSSPTYDVTVSADTNILNPCPATKTGFYTFPGPPDC